MHFTHMCVNTHTQQFVIYTTKLTIQFTVLLQYTFVCIFMEMFYIYVLTYLHYRLMSTRMYDIPEAKKESVYSFILNKLHYNPLGVRSLLVERQRTII